MFKEISADTLKIPVFEEIGKRWMLVAAAKEDGTVNAMTASWGALGVLWGKNVFICYVRPQRYTHEFTESSDSITLAFFDEQYRNALKICGSKSGRDCSKLAESGLTYSVKDGKTLINEASRLIIGKKLYAGRIDPAFFCDKEVDKWYENDYHTVYVCEIEKILEKE